MLRAMAVDVTVKTIEPTPTAVVVAATTWAEFPKTWGPMLDKVWGFLRGGAQEGLYTQGHNIMLYKDDVPNVEVREKARRHGITTSTADVPWLAVSRRASSGWPGG